MTTQLTAFNFNSRPVRVVQIDGEPWFVASDVYPAIKLRQHGGVLNPLDDSEKTKRGRASVGLSPGRDVWIISESGLYKLIMRSDKPEAKAFQDWVTKEVLPTIRKTGSYSVPKEGPSSTQETSQQDDPKDSTIQLLAQTVDRLTVLQANPQVTIETDPLITLQQYEANTHQVIDSDLKTLIAASAKELADRKGVCLGKVWIENHRSRRFPRYDVYEYPTSVLTEAAQKFGH